MKRRRTLRRTVLPCIILTALLFSWPWISIAQQKPSLAILPFFVERLENPARGAVVCPLCQRLYRSGEIGSGAPGVLTTLLHAKMESLGRFLVLPLARVEPILTPQVRAEFELKPLASAIRVGKELNTDFVLVGYVFRFEERVGSSIGVDRPASVGYEMHLLRVRDAVNVWRGGLDETQQPLSENLLKMGSFLKRKASWVIAEELASLGMDEILKKVPGSEELER
jgi:hypothetical protein